MIGLRLVAALSLTVLPGAWLAFARRGDWLPLTARLGVAGALSPVVVTVEFYLMRLAGVSVSMTAWSLVAINLPAAWLVLRHRPLGRAKPASLLQWLFILGLFAAGTSVPWYFIDQLRIYYSHTWMHSAIVSQILSGALLPEEPEVAGLRLAYPWLSHIYWATLAVILDWAPTRVYPFTNLIWLIWTALAVHAAACGMGARSFASRASVVWLALGTNVAGALIFFLTGRLSGDIRYTPWLRKYSFFNDMPFALALLASLLALAVLAVRRKDGRHAVLFAVVLGGAGAVYAVTFPPAFVLAALVPVLKWIDIKRGRGGTMADVLAYAGAVAAGVLGTAAVLKVTVVSRVTSGFELSTLEAGLSKLVSACIVLAPFLTAVGLVVGVAVVRRWRPVSFRTLVDHADSSQVLLLVAAASAVAMGAMFNLQNHTFNEYKLMFCSALFLAPFVAIAIDRLTPPRLPATLVVVLSGVLLAPMFFMQNPLYVLPSVADAPAAAEVGVSLHLAASAPDAGWTDAIREHTPANTLVVVARSNIFVPVATSRSLYAPVVDKAFPGVWLESRAHMIELRGYSRGVVETRLAVVGRLLGATTDDQAQEAWAEIRKFDRPVAIVATLPEQAGLLTWLASRHLGHSIFESDGGSGRVVWFVDR